jgi:hypothetical protein
MTKKTEKNPLGAGRPAIYPLGAKLTARSLYLQGEPYAAIEAATAIPRAYLRRLAYDERWRMMKGNTEEREQAKAATAAALVEWNDQISRDAQSLSIDAVPVIRAAIDKGSARDLKDGAQGLKTLVEVARLTAGMDDKEKPSASAASGVAMFFFAGPVKRAGSVERNVTPSVELAAVGTADPEF